MGPFERDDTSQRGGVSTDNVTEIMPEGYTIFLKVLKERIRKSQLKAAVGVNQELILLYWQIGRGIVIQQEKMGWGEKVIEKLSKDLLSSFPEMRGFSSRNLLFMRSLYKMYPDEEIVKQLVSQIPWGHNVRILDKVNDINGGIWYICQTIENW